MEGIGGVSDLLENGGLVMRGGDGQVESVSLVSALSDPTVVPKEACSSWLPAMATRHVAAIACGGQHTMVLTGGDHIAYTLGRRLFSTAMEETRMPFSPDRYNPSHHASILGLDCVLLVGGSYLYAHKAVLSARSPVLHDMIVQEERPQNDDEEGPLQLLLPDLRYDTAKALLEFIYTGDVNATLDLSSPLTNDLRAAATTYKMHRLGSLCSETDNRRATGSPCPPPSLAANLGSVLGAAEHADVKFLANGRPIYAHKAVLACQSQYFAAMFRSGMLEDRSGSDRNGCGRGIVEVVVPDTYSGLLRLLLFLYSGVLPDCNSDAVLIDLVAADRYRLEDMKRLCQSMLRLDTTNCLQVGG
ncbi:unnamed protein product [Discosporangium mesarthrocarpum]